MKKKEENNIHPRYDADAVFKAFQEKGFTVSHLKKYDSKAVEDLPPIAVVQQNSTGQQEQKQKSASKESDEHSKKHTDKQNISATFIPPAGGLEPDANRIICPICYTFLPSSVVDVKIQAQKSVEMLVGYCKKCEKYYTDNIIARQRQCATAKKPRHNIVWSHIQFRHSQVKHGSIPYEFVSLDGKKLSKKHISAWFQYIQREIGETQKVPTQKSKATGNTKTYANTFSVNHLIHQLPVIGTDSTICPFCKKETDGFIPIRYAAYTTNGHVEQHTYARVCKSCKVIFLEDSQFQQIRRQAQGRHVYSINVHDYPSADKMMEATKKEPKIELPAITQIKLPFSSDLTVKENLSTESKTITIYPQTCHCHKCKVKFGVETITNRTAVVQTVSGEMVDVNVMFCQGCGSYFINIKSFEQYKKLYGGLLFECKLSSDFNKNQYSWFDFAPDSILSRCGYTVKEGVSREYRQAILRYILENEKATKYEIIEHISGFINLRESLPQYRGACQRWREDIAFVNSYRIQYQKKVYGLGFAQGGKVK